MLVVLTPFFRAAGPRSGPTIFAVSVETCERFHCVKGGEARGAPPCGVPGVLTSVVEDMRLSRGRLNGCAYVVALVDVGGNHDPDDRLFTLGNSRAPLGHSLNLGLLNDGLNNPLFLSREVR